MNTLTAAGTAASSSAQDIGVAARDVTPHLPIRLAGYEGRNREADKVDQPLQAQALALRNSSGDRFVFVALDNCEVSHAFMEPVLRQIFGTVPTCPRRGRGDFQPHALRAGACEYASRHAWLQPAERERVEAYSRFLRTKLVEVVGGGARLTCSRPGSNTALGAPPSP